MLQGTIKNGIIAILAGFALGSLVGCSTGGKVPPFEPPPPLPQPPRTLWPEGVEEEEGWDYTWEPDQTWWRQNEETGEWERRDPETGIFVPSAPPPWALQTQSAPLGPGAQLMAAAGGAPGGTGTTPPGAIDYGIVPDANGHVSPRVWVTTVDAASNEVLTADDTLNFYMAADPGWTVPTDTDLDLLEAIGAENVIWYQLSGVSNGAVLHLRNVSVRNLAQFFVETGMPGIDSETPYGTTKLRFDAQSNSVTVKWNDTLIDEILLD